MLISRKSFLHKVIGIGILVGSLTFTLIACGGGGGAKTGSGSGGSSGGGTGGGGSTPTSCDSAAATWSVQTNVSTKYSSKAFGKYVVSNNSWNSNSGQNIWAVDGNCWGVTTNFTNQSGGSILTFPSVSRGWNQNGTIMQQLSTNGTQDWTTKSGMGIKVDQLTKAKVRWAFDAPRTTGWRWLGLMDVYFHKTPNPSYTEFPPFIDLMIDQAIMDQILTGQPAQKSTYYAYVASENNPFIKTLGGVQYLIYIDEPDEASFHQTGGHTIHLFQLPTQYSNPGTMAFWGALDGRHDLKAIIDYFRQANPTDDSGNPIKNATGTTITSALITDDLYLTSAQAGWEIVSGTSFTNTAFCVSMQNEADCP